MKRQGPKGGSHRMEHQSLSLNLQDSGYFLSRERGSTSSFSVNLVISSPPTAIGELPSYKVVVMGKERIHEILATLR